MSGIPTMLERTKLALGVTTTAFDDELTNDISAAVADLGIAGVDGLTVTTDSSDAIVINAIITYCGVKFELLHGNPERSQAYKASYDEQKAQLSMATGYTVFSTEG